MWHLFVVRTKRRDELQAYLQEQGIQTLIHYPIPLHRQEAYKNRFKNDLPLTEEIHEQVLSLPMSPLIQEQQVNQVISELNKF